MKTLAIATVLNAFVLVGFIAVALPAHAATIPCENMLNDMRTAKAAVKLSAADMTKVNDLEARAVERCNADDDVRSDRFLADAMKLMGK